MSPLGPRPAYKSDSRVVLAYTVSPDLRVIGYENDPATGLPTYTRQFTDFCTNLAGAPTADSLDNWASMQYKSQAYSLRRQQYWSGSTLVQVAQDFVAVDTDGYADPDQNTGQTTYHYDILLRLDSEETVLDPGPDPGKTPPSTRCKQLEYDRFGRQSKRSEARSMTDEANFWQKTGALGTTSTTIAQTRAWTYSASQPSTSTVASTETVIQPNLRVDAKETDEHGRPVRLAKTDPASKVCLATTLEYDSANRLLRRTLPTSQVKLTVWDKRSVSCLSVDAAGVVTEVDVDRKNRAERTTVYATAHVDILSDPDPSGDDIKVLVEESSDPDHDRTHYTFKDEFGNQRFSVDPRGYITENRFDGRNRRTSTIRYAQPIGADALKSLLSGQLPDLGGPDDTTVIGPSTQTLYEVTSYYHDADGNLILTVDPEGWCHVQKFDGSNRRTLSRRLGVPLTVARPAAVPPVTTRTTTTPPDCCALFYYDARARVTAQLVGEGTLTLFTYDNNSRRVSSIMYYNRCDIDAALADQSHTRPQAPASHAEDSTKTTHFDEVGKELWSVASDQEAVLRVRDEMGLETATIHFDTRQTGAKARDNREGKSPKNALTTNGDTFRSIHVRFDVFGRKTETSNPWTDAAVVSILSDGSLNPEDRQTQLDTFFTTKAVRTRYAACGLLTKSFNSLNASMDNNVGATIHYYDLRDQLQFTIGPEGEIHEISRNSFGQTVSSRAYARKMLTSDATFQSLTGGTMDAQTLSILRGFSDDSHDVLDQYTFGAGGLKLTETDGGGYATRLHWDYRGLLCKREQSRQDKTSFDVVTTYTYDPRSNKISEQIAASDGSVAVTQSWKYNHAMKKKWTQHTTRLGLVHTHTLDRDGCIVVKHDSGEDSADINFTRDVHGRVLTMTVLDPTLGQLVTSHTHSQKKCTHAVQSPDPNRAQVITTTNVFGERISLSKGGECKQQWTHDASGRWMVETDPLGTTRSVTRNTDGHVIQMSEWDGSVITFTVDNSGQVQSKIEDAKDNKWTTMFVRDGLGRAVSELDPGQVWTVREFPPWKNHTKNSNLCALSIIRDPSVPPTPPTAYRKANQLPPQPPQQQPLNRKTLQTFDGFRQRVSIVRSGLSGDPSHTVTFQTDSLGRPLGKTEDPLGLALKTVNTLDAAGKVTSTTNPRHLTKYFFRDERGLPVFEISAGGICQENGYNALLQRTVQFEYAQKLPSTILDSLKNSRPSLTDLRRTLAPYRATGCYAAEVRNFWGKCGHKRFSAAVVRTDPANYSVGEVHITEFTHDAQGRESKRTIYAEAYTFPTQSNPGEPAWDLSSVIAMAKAVNNPQTNRVVRFVCDGKGNARFTIGPQGAVTEKRFHTDSTVWLTAVYGTPIDLTDSSLDGISVSDMQTKVAGIKNPSIDTYEGSVVNPHGKPIYQYKSHSSTEVSLKIYRYHANDTSSTSLPVYAAEIRTPVVLKTAGGAIIDPLVATRSNMIAFFAAVTPDPKVDSIITHKYQADNTVQSTTDQIGLTDLFERDELGRVHIHTDRNGNQWTQQYDTAQRRIMKTSPTVDVATVVRQSNPTNGPISSLHVRKGWGRVRPVFVRSCMLVP